MTNNDKFIDQMDQANTAAQSQGYVNAIAWARKALENKTITQYDYKKFENLHNLRNLVAHGSACDIQISENTLETAYAFFKAVSQLGITQTSSQGSYLLKEENRNRKRTYVKEGDFVFVARERGPGDPELFGWHTKYKLFVVADAGDHMGLLAVDTYFENTQERIDNPGPHRAFVVPQLPDSFTLDRNPTAWDVGCIRGRNGEFENKRIAFSYSTGCVEDRNCVDIKNLRSMSCEGYFATSECFQWENPLALEDVNLTNHIGYMEGAEARRTDGR